MLEWRRKQGITPIIPPANSKVHESHPQYFYGIGLKDAKHAVDRMYPELAKEWLEEARSRNAKRK